jgi:DNA polymerase-1
MVKVRLPEHILALAEDYTERLISAGENNRVVVLDIETDGLEGNTVWVVGLLPVDKKVQPDMLTIEEARKVIPEYVEQGYFFVIHNAKFDLRVLAKHGVHIPPSQVVDTMLLSYVADPSREGGHSLANLGPKMDYRKALIQAQLLDPKAPKHAEYLVPCNPVMLQYCATDLEVTRDIFRDLSLPMMDKDYAAWCLFAGVEMQFLPIVMEMERTGLHLDIERAKGLVEQWTEQRYVLAQEAQSLAGYVPGKEKVYAKGYHKSKGVTTYNHTPLLPFNPASNDHIAYVLKRLGWEPTKFTATGKPQTDMHVLKELRGQFALVDLLLDIAHFDKLTSMVQSYIEKAQQTGGWVRGDFNQALTLTGRLSSSKP